MANAPRPLAPAWWLLSRGPAKRGNRGSSRDRLRFILMPRICTVCVHPHRGAIDGLLATGTSAGHVAARFSLGPDAVERHARNHVTRSVQAVRAALAPPREEIIAPLRLDGLLTVQGVAQRLAGVVARCEKLVEDAEAGDSIGLRGAALRELRGALSDALRAATMFQPEGPSTQAADVDADIIADRLLAALADHPEARRKAAQALAGLARA